MTRLKTMTNLPLGVLHCIRLIRQFKPQVVIGVGGYASGPAMLAAVLLRVPTLVYEPNAIPGFTNRVLGKRVSAAAVAFAETVSYFRKAEVTGVPVRAEIFSLPEKPGDMPPRILVTAGSNGALIFNETMPLIAVRLLDAIPGLTIMHQSGARPLEATQSAFAASGADPARYTVTAFLNDMPAQYAAADVVLARAGSTIAELCAAGKPSVLVPLPTAADDHQRKNAEVLANAGAALMILQKDVTPDSLLATLMELFKNKELRDDMSAKARALAKPGALEKIAVMVLELSH
jgi:UDP-N-acetylglucosamine--N-acetylmuramyl-(pentapeptide) pyrophosphoryl-undecaprenol N-acetylglucosamine transferase